MRSFHDRDRFWAMVRDVQQERLTAELELVAEYTESPLEEAAVLGLWVACSDRPFDVMAWEEFRVLMDYPLTMTGERADPVSVSVVLQRPFGPYRVDLSVVAAEANGERVMILVELDGHDFHEKTKAQAASDKKRDRELTKDGTPMMRFTGSEIIKDPVARMREVVASLLGRLKQKRSAGGA